MISFFGAAFSTNHLQSTEIGASAAEISAECTDKALRKS